MFVSLSGAELLLIISPAVQSGSAKQVQPHYISQTLVAIFVTEYKKRGLMGYKTDFLLMEVH